MNSLKDILSYIKKDDKPKSWEEIKTHFNWDIQIARKIWDMYFGDKAPQPKYVMESHIKTESGSQQIWRISPAGIDYLEQKSFASTWIDKKGILLFLDPID